MPNSPNNMPCKFDPEHGTFATPPKLAQHYREVHGDVWQPKPPNTRRYRCAICGGVYRNPGSHVDQRHPDNATRPVVGRVMLRIDDGDEGVGGVGRPANGVDVLETLHDIEEARTKVPRHVGPWEVDDIVLPVVEQLAAPRGLIPVAHLAAILAWRDATAVMLSAVTGR